MKLSPTAALIARARSLAAELAGFADALEATQPKDEASSPGKPRPPLKRGDNSAVDDVLDFIINNPATSGQAIRAACLPDLSSAAERRISRVLQHLAKQGLIRTKGKTSGRRYWANARARAARSKRC